MSSTDTALLLDLALVLRCLAPRIEGRYLSGRYPDEMNPNGKEHET